MIINYRQSILVFGLALPLLIIALLMGGALYVKGQFNQTYEKKLRLHAQGKQLERQIGKVKKELAKSDQDAKMWAEIYAAHDRRSYTLQWKEIGSQFRPKEFQFQSPTWKSQSAGLGKTGQAEQVSMNFEATFLAMQTALLEMETRMPQLQLDSMQMAPNSNGETLNINTTYTIWTDDKQ